MSFNPAKNKLRLEKELVKDSFQVRAYMLLRTVQEIQNSLQNDCSQMTQINHRKKIASNRWK